MRRQLAFVFVFGLVAGLLVPTAPALAASKPGKVTAGAPQDYWKIRGLSKSRFQTVRESFQVEMKDGVNIYVEVVRPKKKGRYGTILELSPYHGTLANRDGTRIFPGPKGKNGQAIGLTGYFAPRGYAVVMADLRGTGRSQGCLDHMGPKDQSDAKEIVQWAAKQRWSNGRVGMTGHSYVGSTPQMAAAQRPKALKTIVPSAGLAAMYHHEFQDGVPYNLQWAGPLFAYEQLAMERHLPGGDHAGEDMQDFGCGWTQSAAVTGESYMSGAEEEWHRERDFRKGVTKAKIPVFNVHGVHDNAARIAAIDWFNARKRRGDKAWIGQWDHGSGRGPNGRTCDETGPACGKKDQWTKALHAWFDKHLLRRKVRTGPPVELFLNDDTVFTSPVWPPPAGRLRLFPHADGSLQEGRDDAGTSAFVSDHRGFSSEFQTNNLAWATPKFSKDTLLAGIPKLRLVASSSSPRVHIIASLYDLGPDGRRSRVSRATWAIQPELRDGWDKAQPVIPGEMMNMKLTGMAQAHVLKKGHRLELRVVSSHPDKVPTFGGGSAITVAFGGKDGSTLTLPAIVNPRVYRDPLN